MKVSTLLIILQLISVAVICSKLTSEPQSVEDSLDTTSSFAQIFIKNIPLMGEMKKIHMELSKKRVRQLEEIEEAVLRKHNLPVSNTFQHFSNSPLAQKENFAHH